MSFIMVDAFYRRNVNVVQGTDYTGKQWLSQRWCIRNSRSFRSDMARDIALSHCLICGEEFASIPWQLLGLFEDYALFTSSGYTVELNQTKHSPLYIVTDRRPASLSLLHCLTFSVSRLDGFKLRHLTKSPKPGCNQNFLLFSFNLILLLTFKGLVTLQWTFLPVLNVAHLTPFQPGIVIHSYPIMSTP